MPGAVLATGDTEMNGTHCPLIPAPSLCPKVQSQNPALRGGGGGHHGQNRVEKSKASESGNQDIWVHVHHSQAT